MESEIPQNPNYTSRQISLDLEKTRGGGLEPKNHRKGDRVRSVGHHHSARQQSANKTRAENQSELKFPAGDQIAKSHKKTY
jgi:hypothetical protein